MRRNQFLIAALMFSVFSVNAADIDAGKTAAASCAGCHGPDGNSPNPQWPSLAGQQASFLQTQLKAFKSGARVNAMMQGFAATLDDTAIDNVSAYYASLTPKAAAVDDTRAAAGKATYDATCASCHGADGKGNEMYPQLAYQHPEYLAIQIKNFKSGQRDNAIMKAMVGALSDEQIDDVAAYAGSLP